MECFVPWNEYTPVLHRDTVITKQEAQRFKEGYMPTAEELEQAITAMIDQEETAAAILIEDRHIEKRDVRT